jgi:hypothetical protein
MSYAAQVRLFLHALVDHSCHVSLDLVRSLSGILERGQLADQVSKNNCLCWVSETTSYRSNHGDGDEETISFRSI